jgi:isoleucyl-tRNA synthetase
MIEIKDAEEKVLNYWKDNSVHSKIKSRNKEGKPYFFLEGPPYASGILASHHIWVYSVKDIVLRYRRYKGLNVHDRAGYDVHGLPIENKVERKLNVSSKADIEGRIGIEKFVETCQSFADEHVAIAVKAAERFGISLDFKNMYIPSKNDYISSSWGVFKKIYDKGLVYKDVQPLAYCPHCETVLSAQGPEVEYSNENDPSIFIRFKISANQSKLKLPDETYLLVWTTTPWTLPANMAIAANPSAMYVLVKIEDKNYILAKERLANFVDVVEKNAVVMGEFYGSELGGTPYINALQAGFPSYKKISKYHKVLLDEALVSVSEGTGLVHIAPGHGLEDYRLSKKSKIPVFSPVDDHARYTAEAGKYIGLSVPAEANKRIISDLKDSGDLMFSGNSAHSYPHCWRCHERLIFKATEQWFINVQKIKKAMLRENNKVTWHPSNAKEWQDDAIQSSPDWCISRQRYWGIPMPIWKCGKCDWIEVVGDVYKLMEMSGLEDQPKDLHRPYVDAIGIKCGKCGSESKRIKDVFDVWYDSGVAHTASLTPEEFTNLYPAAWISESRDQIRGWFSTLLRTGVAVYGKTPFKEVNIGGMLMDELGEEMHRHLGNSVNAMDILNLVSADGWRLWSTAHPRWQVLKLKKNELVEADRNIITLYNIAELAKEFAALYKVDTKSIGRPSASKLKKEDQWILSRLNSLKRECTEALETYEIDVAVKKVKEFLLEDFSRFYLKFAKQRATNSRSEGKLIGKVVNYVLKEFLVVASVVIPFSTESVYQELYSNGESIFMESWPKPVKKYDGPEVESDFEVMKDLTNTILGLREKHQLTLRQPLAAAIVESSSDSAISAIERTSLLISSYTNVKEVKVVKSQVSRKQIKPVFPKLGPAFKGNAQLVADELSRSDANAVEKEVSEKGVYSLHTKQGVFDIKAEHFTVFERAEDGELGQFKYGTVKLDTTLTEELREELLVREITRRIQMMRKDGGLTKMDRANVAIFAEGFANQVVSKNLSAIKSGTNSSSLKLVSGFREDEEKDVKSFDLVGTTVRIRLEKI